MIIVKENNEVITNTVDAKNFKVKASAKAFKILSSNIYKDKITAPIRELICNAIDSHIQAKNKQPIIVHLPNTLEPTFFVQDFGVGLSDKEIKNLYTTYFDSTKTDSNDYTGALGLGSKSPFCYTDTFNIVSVKDGKKGTYVAYINEIGMPCITTLNIEKTQEQNGVKVEFAVKENDYSTFEWRFKDFAYYCDFDIQVLNGIKVETIYELNKDYKFKKYFLNQTNAHCAYIVQGNVAYPLNINTLFGDEEQKNRLIKAVKRITKGKAQNLYSYQLEHLVCGKVFLANIGEVDFTASREEISYDKNTCKVIADKIIHYLELVFKAYNDNQNKKQSTFEKFCNAQELCDKEPALRYFINSGDYTLFQRKVKKNQKLIPSFVSNEYGRKFCRYEGKYQVITLSRSMRVILANSHKEYLRLREYFKQAVNKSKYIWIFEKEEYTKNDMAILRSIFGGFNNFEKSTDIEYKRAKKERATYPKTIRVLTPKYLHIIKSTEITEKDCKYHCFARGKHLESGDFSQYHFDLLVSNLIDEKDKILLLRPNNKKYDSSKDLVCALKKLKNDYIKHNLYKLSLLALQRESTRLFGSYTVQDMALKNIKSFNFLKVWLQRAEKIANTNFSTIKNDSFLDLLKNDATVQNQVQKMLKRVKEVLNKYAMLRYIDFYGNDDKEFEFALKDYIKMVENKKEK